MLHDCLGIAFDPPMSRAHGNLGRLMRTRLEAVDKQELVRYLALESDLVATQLSPIRAFKSTRSAPTSTNLERRSLTDRICEFLTSQVHICLDRVQDIDVAATQITAQDAHQIYNLCLVGFSIASTQLQDPSPIVDELNKALVRLNHAMQDVVRRSERSQTLAEGIVRSFEMSSYALHEYHPGRGSLLNGTIMASQGMSPEFWRLAFSSSLSTEVNDDNAELMDLDLEFHVESQQDQRIDHVSDLLHNTYIVSTSQEAVRATVIAKVCYMSMIGNRVDSSTTSMFVEYLTNLKHQDFLLCHCVLRELLNPKMGITEDDADTILQYVYQTLTQRYETRRSEVALGLCLDTLTDLVYLWTSEDSDCAGSGAELYMWLRKQVLLEGWSSAHTLLRAASLYRALLLETKPDHGDEPSASSPRTGLFDLLEQGDLQVKFEVGKSLSNIFAHFVLLRHEEILDDVMERLPKDPDWVEGLAVRLFVLAHLASSWSTLLRRCVYAIFETPGQISSSTNYAHRCIRMIANALGFKRSQTLFELFAPQILYTWLEGQSLETIPFQIFDFQSNEELLLAVKDEVSGQVFMRGDDRQADDLSTHLGCSGQTLIESSFSKVAAYTIARDIAFSASSSPSSGAESRVRKILKDQYAKLVDNHFADIVALFFINMDFEEHIGRAFSKKPRLALAAASYQEMISRSASELTLPPNQQPSFKARHLIDQIERLCERTRYDLDEIWTPALYAHVLRRLLRLMQPAFGSLHACSIVRKIRILACLAGPTAVKGYPLEMALHALQPYLTDTQCADDTVGVVQYLIEHSSSYLARVPSFLIGVSTSMLISLRGFFDSTQDSTTQEAQFKATLAKAQGFHTWLASFLSQYAPDNIPIESAQSFQRIVSAAANSQNRSNSRVGTHESDLLLELMEDERSERGLLDHFSRESIFRTLCDSFDPSPDFRDDILGDDLLASKFASIIARSCLRGMGNDYYIKWCGQVLGRAYAGSGRIEGSILAESSGAFHGGSTFDGNVPREGLALGVWSRTKILQLVCGLLHSNNQREVGAAEDALRYIVTSSSGIDVYNSCNRLLPRSLMEALLWKDFSLPDSVTKSLNPTDIEASQADLPTSGIPSNSRDWIQKLFEELGDGIFDDPVLASLPFLFQCASSLADEIFPYALHLTLLQDFDTRQSSKVVVSALYRKCFDNNDHPGKHASMLKTLINGILYLHTQPLPHEIVKADRTQWFDLEYESASLVAADCHLFKTALLLLEMSSSQRERRDTHSSRRSSSRRHNEYSPDSSALLMNIYQNLDEEDAFHGIQKPSSLISMMRQLEYENSGFKTLSFKGAYLDSGIRQTPTASRIESESMVRVLGGLDLNGLSQAVLAASDHTGLSSMDAALGSARKLEKWDISAPSTYVSAASVIFRTFQGLNVASSGLNIETVTGNGFNDLMKRLREGNVPMQALHSTLAGLAVLSEMSDVVSSQGYEQLQEVATRFEAREDWMKIERYPYTSLYCLLY